MEKDFLGGVKSLKRFPSGVKFHSLFGKIIGIEMEMRKDRRKSPPFLLFSKKCPPPYSTGPFPKIFSKSDLFDSKMLSNDDTCIVYMIFRYRVAQSPKFSRYGTKKVLFKKMPPPHTPRKSGKRTPLLPGGKKRPPLPLRRSFLKNIEISISESLLL